MLFRKRIKRACEYCAKGTRFSTDQILCVKRGVVSIYYKCRHFSYDPCKRVPLKPKALNFKIYDNDDFSL